MKFEKKALINLDRCYSVGSITIDDDEKIIMATEGHGGCYIFDGENYDNRTTVWDGPGGTMCTVPIPNTNGEFLAVQNFFPTFQSEDATIVWAKPKEEGWEIKTLFNLPYVHRFDILSAGDKHYFIGATLCTSKKFKDDWSDPGKIYVGELPSDLNEKIELKIIKEGLTKNHGYCRTQWEGKMAGIFTSEEGVLVITPPQSEDEDWKIEKIINRPVSDVAVVDIDEDGEDELLTIEPFHGNKFAINKKINGEYKVIYEYPKKVDFGHGIWGGKLRGIPTFLGGYRREEEELFYIQCEDKEKLTFKAGTIDSKVGPSNIDVIYESDRDIIISANRQIGEGAIYFVTDK